MVILITKGERQDRIEASRADGSSVRTTFAKKGPIPHDAVHFFVEQQLGVARGFWGLVAAGHHPEEISDLAKAAGHASAKRAGPPQPHIVPILQAERIVECFEADLWGGNGDNDSLRAMAKAGCEQSLVPVPVLDDAAIDRIRAAIFHLLNRWAELPVGGSISLHWQGEQEPARA